MSGSVSLSASLRYSLDPPLLRTVSGWRGWAFALWFALVASCTGTASNVRPPAVGSCPQEASDWVEKCSNKSSFSFHIERCVPGAILLEVTSGPLPLRVEVTREPGRGFRRAHGVGVSPIGEFGDWELEPEATRAGLDALVSCAEFLPSSALPEGAFSPQGGGATGSVRRLSPGPWPWRLMLAVLGVLGVVCCAVLYRRFTASLSLLGAVAVAAALAAAALGTVCLGFSYAHQNGQGPTWAWHALGDHPGLAAYGPGYREVFSWAAALAPFAPEGPLLVLQLALWVAMTAACCVAVHVATQGSWLGVACVCALAMDPIRLRLVASESYFGAAGSLLMGATAAFAVGAVDDSRVRRLASFGVGAWALALAIRMHPVVWVPAACIPWIALLRFRPGGVPWGRGIEAGIAAALIVGATAGGVVLRVLRGAVGAAWLPSVGTEVSWEWWSLVGVSMLGFAVAVATRGHSAVASRVTSAAVALGAVALPEALSLLGKEAELFRWGYLGLAGPVLALAAATLCNTSRRTRIAGLVACIAFAAWPARWEAAFTTATDVQEAAWVQQWRESLPSGARIAYLARAGHRLVDLPIFVAHTSGEPHVALLPLTTEELETFGPPSGSFYVRTSLCASPEARAACAAFERRVPLRSLRKATFDARPSRPVMPYAGSEVRVDLYAIEPAPW